MSHLHRRADDFQATEGTPPAPLTEEQLHWIEQQTIAAAEKAGKYVWKRAIWGFVVFVVALILVAGYNNHQNTVSRDAIVQSGQAVAVDGCNRDYQDRVQFRGLLERLKEASKVSYQSGRTTKDQYDTAVDFYDDQLKKFALPDCRDAENLLTSDPNKDLPVIKPYYQGNPDAPNG